MYQAKYYRGIHLAAQLSKVIERLIKLEMGNYVFHPTIVGLYQYAYQPGKGARDAILFLSISIDSLNN